MADNISALDLAIAQVDETFQSTSKIRDSLIGKMQLIVNALQVSPDDEDPKTLDAKMHIVETLQNLLKDKESGVVTTTKIKLQKKDTDSSDAARQMVVEMLKSINIKETAASVGKTVIPSDLDSKVEAAIIASKHDISDDELEINPSEE